MSFKLEGKKAFITGSTSGIGLAIAQKLEEYGCQVAINSKNKKSFNKAKTFFKKPVKFICGDMTSDTDSKNAIEEFIKYFGSIDILICNIGNGRSASPGKELKGDWEKSISINLLSATNPISYSIGFLQKTSGVIICISSICGDKMIENAPLTYSSIKAALNRFVINSSYYFAKKNIRINAVSPGNVFFPGSIWEKKFLENPNQINEMLSEKIPLKKFVALEDISEAVAFLSSPLSKSTTGQILKIDAGQSVT